MLRKTINTSDLLKLLDANGLTIEGLAATAATTANKDLNAAETLQKDAEKIETAATEKYDAEYARIRKEFDDQKGIADGKKGEAGRLTKKGNDMLAAISKLGLPRS